MKDKKKINDYIITKKEISNLLSNMEDGISTHELSMWLKSKTNDEWVVMPRFFCAMTIAFFEEKAEATSKTFSFSKEVIQELKELKNYL